MENKIMRYSRQREEILKIVKRTRTHPTADWIYERVRKRIPNVSLGTVYRNLNQMVAAGMIRSIQDETVVRYDGNLDPHDHFKCTVCGKVYDVHFLDQDLLETFNRNHDYVATDYTLELRGTCSACLQGQHSA
jgi:Fur family peroxide stress response transcriptional regulator